MMVTVQYNEREEIRISRPPIEHKPCRGIDVVDFRTFTKSKKGNWSSTQRGITFDAALLHEVLRALVDVTNRKGGAS